MNYECKTCMFITNLRANYDRHVKTSKHTKLNPISTQIQQIEEPVSTKIQPKTNNFTCKYCDKEFGHMQSMYRHIKYSCKKNKDEDMKELIRLLNIQLQQKDQELKQKDKQISKLVDKLGIHGGIFNTIIQTNPLLSYRDTDLSHLTDKNFIRSIKQVNFCVKDLIEQIHFNPAKPENMNIYISNMKDKYMMMYENGTWNMKHKSELDDIYTTKEMLLEQWIEEGQHKYPEIKQKFIQYIHNKDNDETINWIKEDIKLMMYNKRTLCLEN